MGLFDEMAVSDIVWSIESGQEIAVNRLYWKHNHIGGTEYTWQEGLQRMSDKIVSALLVDQGGQQAPRALIHQSVALTRVDSYQLDASGHAVNKATSTPTQGTNTGGMGGTAMPPQIGPILQLWAYTGFVDHARRHRGRMFLPPAATSALATNGRLSDSWRGDLLNAWTSFFNNCQGAHLNDNPGPGTADYASMGVLSRRDGKFYQLERLAVPPDVAVQRSRINKLSKPLPSFGTINHG